MKPEDIIIKPIITERSSMDQMAAKYTFEVARNATKAQIKEAVEKLFDVKVLSVNTIMVKGKMKRVRYVAGKTSDWKKAIVAIDTNPSPDKYIGKNGKEVTLSKKYKTEIEAFNA